MFRSIALVVLLSSCSCAAVHELDGGATVPDSNTLPDGAPRPSLFPMCGNPNVPTLGVATSGAPADCTAELDDVCAQWGASFGAPGTTDAHCWRIAGGAPAPRVVCVMGSVCPDGHAETCQCTMTGPCGVGEACVTDSPGGTPHCVAGCSDLTQCFPTRVVNREAGTLLFTQGPFCPPDAGGP